PKWDREVQVNLSAIVQAQADLQSVLLAEEGNAELQEEARQLYDQLESSKAYYDWLKRLADSVQSGEIFKFIPIETDEKNA
ncbi:GbsR/MarR family transcriptional regulator, partial [Bacillus velezensis]